MAIVIAPATGCQIQDAADYLQSVVDGFGF
jgi:hypothetical protein